MSHTLFVEKKSTFANEARHLLHDLRESLNLQSLVSLRFLNRYNVEGISEEAFSQAASTILSEPQTDLISRELNVSTDEIAFAYAYLPGQFDQRADSAAQCIQILTGKDKPTVHSSQIIILKGNISDTQLSEIKSYVINAVDSHEVPVAADSIRHAHLSKPGDIEILQSFLTDTPPKIRKAMSLAMSEADVAFTQDYFKNQEGRPPTLTEIRMLDTYWSDHCRHTTFLTAIDDIKFGEGSELIEETYQIYRDVRKKLNRDDRPVTLMDIALIGMRELKASGELDNLEVSEEINAASIVVKIQISNFKSQSSSSAPLSDLSDSAVKNPNEEAKEEEWLIQFKNETHNHPTEIEPFGGAAHCLGGCKRDPLSGRSYVYQAMRVTGAANPLTPFSETLPGKLPQKKICQIAAKGYSSYGNQIGLATGQVAEVYHPGYVAKRLEIGAVVAAAPRSNVFRGTPAPGDVILLIGGRTGRDGVGGATGSSKEHTDTALENSAEVQKGDAPTERKIQRLFRNPELTRKIKICNDFGAGGVSVAIGEIAPSLI
ncbi:MAG: AIR synthase-related protein, partial [Akkermansiaceae bacterium]